MRLSYITENPNAALNYCERRVNIGSRSNFTEQFLPREIGNPFTCDRFFISALLCSQDNLTTYGSMPEFCASFCSDERIYVHPDLRHYYPDYSIETTQQAVAPTSSSRTVKVLSQPYYLKLCYPDRIGRVTRELDERHIYSSLDITERFERMCLSKKVSDKFAFMPERGGMLFCDGDTKIGLVVRQQSPVGKNVASISSMIPGFSLFSKDRDFPFDSTLLSQLLAEAHNDFSAEEYLLKQFCYPLIDVFFNCVMIEGIVPELHSQNVMFGFDDEWNVQSIIIRDLESHDKDITLMKRLNKADKLDSYPFKCIEDTHYNYAIKHSFMFDHKLGEYLIAELIRVTANGDNGLFQTLCDKVKGYVLQTYGAFIAENRFFPHDGKWYKFKNVVVDRTKASRPYDVLNNPLFR